MGAMRFTKMHGLGNDYVYVDCFEQTIDDPATVAQQVSDRHFGIGADGLILIMPSDAADVQRGRVGRSDVRERDPMRCEVCVRPRPDRGESDARGNARGHQDDRPGT